MKVSTTEIRSATIVSGAAAERGSLLPCFIFIFFWLAVVHNPMIYWAWNVNGWIYRLGVIELAGGIPVHTSAGVASLAYSYAIGPRQRRNVRPHNTILIGLGTALFWVGSLGMLSSALPATARSGAVLIDAILSACAGGVAWTVVDFYYERTWSIVSFSAGSITGLIGITSSAGYVLPWAAFLQGLITSILCNFSTSLKCVMRCDDALDLFAVHAVGGISGSIFTALFAT